MNKPATTEANTPAVPAQPKEKILFEIQPLLLPTIMNMENLVMIGLVFLAVVVAMFFHVGLLEFLIFAVIFLIIAVPSFRSIFRAGSTSYVLTNRRLMIFTVGFGPKERSIPLEQIQDVKVRSSGLQRFYGAGDVIVYMRNLGRPVRLLGLKECKRRAEQIMQAAKKARGQA